LKKPSEIRVYAAGHRAPAAFILAHGAGAGHDSAFMVGFAKALRDLGLDLVTFNFLYIEEKRKIPDRGPVLNGKARRLTKAWQRSRIRATRARHRRRSWADASRSRSAAGPRWRWPVSVRAAASFIRPDSRTNCATRICPT
jgi:hypothetical protein